MTQQPTQCSEEVTRITLLSDNCLSCAQQGQLRQALTEAAKVTEGMLFFVARKNNFIMDQKPRDRFKLCVNLQNRVK